MEDEQEAQTKTRWELWRARAVAALWMLLWIGFFYYQTYGSQPVWTPVMYRAGAENDPIKLSRVRTLSECQMAPLSFWRGVRESGGSIMPWGDLCMRECYFLEDIVRPNAVRDIRGRCYVVVNGEAPRVLDSDRVPW